MAEEINLTVISQADDKICMVQIPKRSTISDLKKRIQKELGVDPGAQTLIIPENNQNISSDNAKTLSSLGVKDQALIMLVANKVESDNRRAATDAAESAAPRRFSGTTGPSSAFGSKFAQFKKKPTATGQSAPSTLNRRSSEPPRTDSWPEMKKWYEDCANDETHRIGQHFKKDLDQIYELNEKKMDGVPFAATQSVLFPEFGAALETHDRTKIRQAYLIKLTDGLKKEFNENKRLQKAQADPTSAAAQEILMENARKNYLRDQEDVKKQLNLQERVNMLYIPIQVKNHKTDEWIPINAFVDTGCQATLMSQEMMHQLGLEKLLDRSRESVAMGVGVQKMIGTIHMLPAMVGEQEIMISCSVMEHMPQFMFGLDLMIQHGAVLDLGNSEMKLMGQTIKFLTAEEQIAAKIIEAPDEKPSQGQGNRQSEPLSPQMRAQLNEREQISERRDTAIAVVRTTTGCDQTTAIEHLEMYDWDAQLVIAVIQSMQ